MVSVRNTSVRVPAVALLLLVLCAPSLSGAGVKATFLYNLSNFSGTVNYSWVRPYVDSERSEIYVVTGDSVTVFNASGMEVYRFGDDLNIGGFMDVSVESDGHIIILSRVGDQFRLTRCNYRGEPQARIEIRNLPKEFAGISPGRLLARNGKLYLADLFVKKVVVTNANGIFQDGIDIAPLLSSFEEKPGTEFGIDAHHRGRGGEPVLHRFHPVQGIPALPGPATLRVRVRREPSRKVQHRVRESQPTTGDIST